MVVSEAGNVVSFYTERIRKPQDLARMNLAMQLAGQLPDEQDEKRRALNYAAELVRMLLVDGADAAAKRMAIQLIVQLPDGKEALATIEATQRIIDAVFGACPVCPE